ncbi:hypothetical protein FHW36_102679 [Chitinophaga polysaccharea]|uniref:Uncharacterized protein n=1 Tax=Chitinophaga polysaccharea TaxID=1293035 RepID=A0A561PXT9_9BACT|nr:hypothetical protein [Chitinophaga polysaccharea]TWF42917.1 hypothetical protein FHW36_102679 [Chitinophaga polysaccharea]
MWSYLYWYYEIRGNATYNQKILTSEVLNVLENTGKLCRTAHQQFSNLENFPWINIVAVHSKDGNYGRDEDFNSEWVNLIAVVGSKSNPENEALYVTLLTQIAENIHWELILAGGDDHNENIVLREKSIAQ